jgi:hypothetical protein
MTDDAFVKLISNPISSLFYLISFYTASMGAAKVLMDWIA